MSAERVRNALRVSALRLLPLWFRAAGRRFARYADGLKGQL
jgi:hypothetical protein